MWFRYPEGWNNITVEQMEFGVVHKDRDGHQYFVAPESLAAQILVVPGFVVVARPADAPADIQDNTPAGISDPLAQLSGQVEAFRLENDTLKKGVADLTKERDDARAELSAVQATMAREHEVTQAGAPAAATPVAPSPTPAPAGTRK